MRRYLIALLAFLSALAALSPAEAQAGPTGLPTSFDLRWPVVGRISQYFQDPSWNPRHTGIDIAVPTWTPIRASEDGTVSFAGWSTRGYGYRVVIYHNRNFQTSYSHMVKAPLVREGQWVERGEVIGYVGSTGYSTGPHLHFEVIYRGYFINPLRYLP